MKAAVLVQYCSLDGEVKENERDNTVKAGFKLTINLFKSTVKHLLCTHKH